MSCHKLLLAFLLFPLAACASHPSGPMPPMAARVTATPPTPQAEPDELPLMVREGDKVLRIERHRPLKSGDQYDIEGHSVFDVQVTLPAILQVLVTKGSRLESGAKVFDIAGRVRIDSLDSAGKPADATFTVKTCTGAGETLLPEGAIVDAKATPGGMTYTRRDGKKITREVTQALLGIFNQEKGAGAPPKAKEGSDVPHTIGDTWPVDVPTAADRPVGDGSKAHITDMQAWTTLTAMKVLGGIPAVEVESGMKAILRIEALPMGFKAKPAEIQAKQTVLYPVDPTLQPLTTERQFNTEINVEGSFLFMPVSADVKVTMNQHMTAVQNP